MSPNLIFFRGEFYFQWGTSGEKVSALACSDLSAANLNKYIKNHPEIFGT